MSADRPVSPPAKDALTARQIMEMATLAAGGDAWRYAKTLVMSGHATLHQDDGPIHADDYQMQREMPRRLNAAHTGTGRFRITARTNGKIVFEMAFDGHTLYNQSGPLPQKPAEKMMASSFGFSAARFALEDDFRLERQPDDRVEGHACWFVKVIDPGEQETLFAIDQQQHVIRYVGWDSPRGWHHRVYSDFYWVDPPHFRQPGRVRLYYDGVKSADVVWTRAVVDAEIPDHAFRILP